jgi:hypothetical protein
MIDCRPNTNSLVTQGVPADHWGVCQDEQAFIEHHDFPQLQDEADPLFAHYREQVDLVEVVTYAQRRFALLF